MNKIPAESLCQTLAVNVNNPRLSDASFRELVRNTLPITDFQSTVSTVPNNDDPDGDIDPMTECPNKGRYIR